MSPLNVVSNESETSVEKKSTAKDIKKKCRNAEIWLFNQFHPEGRLQGAEICLEKPYPIYLSDKFALL